MCPGSELCKHKAPSLFGDRASSLVSLDRVREQVLSQIWNIYPWVSDDAVAVDYSVALALDFYEVVLDVLDSDEVAVVNDEVVLDDAIVFG